MKPAVAYARYSSELQDDMSIVAQLQEIHKWAEAHGYVIIEEYIDSALTGSSERRELTKIKQAVKSRDCPFVAIIAWKSNRIYRDANKAGLFEEDLERKQIQLLYVAESNAKGPQGKLVRRIMNSMNEYYLEDLGIEVLSKSKTWFSQGYAPGGTPPFGYKKIPVEVAVGDKVLIKKRYAKCELSHHVVWIYKQYASGTGINKIARMLNDKGIKTPRGGLWHGSQIHNVLFANRDTYMGKIVYNKQWREKPPAYSEKKKSNTRKHYKDKSEWVIVENAHEALVSQELADAVDSVRDNRPPKLNLNAKKGKRVRLLSGLLKCYKCGHNFLIGQGSSRLYYTCGGRRTANIRVVPVTCDNDLWIRVEKIEALVREEFIKRMTSPSLMEEIREGRRRIVETKEDSLGAILEGLQAELAQARRREDNLLDAIADGTVTKALAKVKLGQIAEQKERIEEELKKLSVQEGSRDLSQFDQLPVEWYKDDKSIRTMMLSFVQHIIMYPTNAVIVYDIPISESVIQFR